MYVTVAGKGLVSTNPAPSSAFAVGLQPVAKLAAPTSIIEVINFSIILGPLFNQILGAFDSVRPFGLPTGVELLAAVDLPRAEDDERDCDDAGQLPVLGDEGEDNRAH